MNVTADFQQGYAATLRNMKLNESEIVRHTQKLASTEGLSPDLLAAAHFEKIITERNLRVEEKARATFRRIVCGACMIGPISALAAGALLYVAI